MITTQDSSSEPSAQRGRIASASPRGIIPKAVGSQPKLRWQNILKQSTFNLAVCCISSRQTGENVGKAISEICKEFGIEMPEINEIVIRARSDDKEDDLAAAIRRVGDRIFSSSEDD